MKTKNPEHDTVPDDKLILFSYYFFVHQQVVVLFR